LLQAAAENVRYRLPKACSKSALVFFYDVVAVIAGLSVD
jgi:hypothetical protein